MNEKEYHEKLIAECKLRYTEKLLRAKDLSRALNILIDLIGEAQFWEWREEALFLVLESQEIHDYYVHNKIATANDMGNLITIADWILNPEE